MEYEIIEDLREQSESNGEIKYSSLKRKKSKDRGIVSKLALKAIDTQEFEMPMVCH